METDLFGHEVEPQAADPVIGLAVDLQQQCRCGAYIAVIGPGKGPHLASLHCQACEKHRGWVSRESHRFISETIRLFGRPTAPIKVQRGDENRQGEAT
jgi:hypothetical protein